MRHCKIYRKTSVMESFSNKTADLGMQLHWKVTPTQLFSCAFFETFKNTPFSRKTSGDGFDPGYFSILPSLRKKCSYSELFWSAFSRIRTRITPNTDTFQARQCL